MFYCTLESCILDQHTMETLNIFSLKLDRLLSRRQYDKKYLVTIWECTQVTLDAITMVGEHQYSLYPKLFIFPMKIFEPNSQWLFLQAELSILCHVFWGCAFASGIPQHLFCVWFISMLSYFHYAVFYFPFYVCVLCHCLLYHSSRY